MNQMTISDLLQWLESIQKYQGRDYKNIPLVVLDKDTGKEIPIIAISVNRDIFFKKIKDVGFITEEKHIKKDK